MPAPGRLLVVTESLGIGGTESHLVRLLPHLAARGWTVATFCLTEPGERAHEVERAGIEVVSVARGWQKAGPLLRHPTHVARAAKALYWLIRRFRPDIVHFYLPGPYLVGAPVAMAARVPIKVMSRRSLSVYQRGRPAAARIERLLHRRMDAVTGNSRAVVDELIGEGVPEAKLRLIYNGIDVVENAEDRDTARQALGLERNGLVGVMVANLIPYKGHRELIEGLSEVASALPPGWRILLAGRERDPGYKSELETLATARGIKDNIQFLGERLDISRLLAAADFALLTSHQEGFSNVVLEGMAAELPIIATRVGGNPEAVLDGTTGVLVPSGDPAAIGNAVLRLARDADLGRRLGQAGRQRVAEIFSMDACIAAHDRLYRDLLAARVR